MIKRGFKQIETGQHRGRAVAALLCLALVSAPVASYADDVDQVCSSVLSLAKQQGIDPSNPNATATPTAGATGAPVNQQKLQYCQAARSAQDGADADGVMWKVWAGVAAVCTTACVLAATAVVDGGTTQYVCMGASVAGGITDAVVSKSFMNALMGIGGAFGTFAVNSVTSSGTDAAGKAKPQKDWGSCLAAAMAAIQVFTKYSSMSGENDTVKSSLDSARKLADTDSPSTDGSGNSMPAPMGDMSGSGGNNGNGGAVATNIAPGTSGSGTSSNTACGSANSNGQVSAIQQCASADSNLPGFFGTPRFDKELKKDSGMDFGDFFNKAQTPAQAMAMGTGGALNPGQEMKLAAAVQDLGQHFSDGQGEVYASGGAGGNGGGGNDMDMGAMMAGLMDQLNPNKKKAQERLTGVNAVAFANQKRGPAAVAEDRTLSIFDRVSYRYYFVGREILFGGNGK